MIGSIKTVVASCVDLGDKRVEKHFLAHHENDLSKPFCVTQHGIPRTVQCSQSSLSMLVQVSNRKAEEQSGTFKGKLWRDYTPRSTRVLR